MEDTENGSLPDVSAIDGSLLVLNVPQSTSNKVVITDRHVFEKCGKRYKSIPGLKDHQAREYETTRYTCAQCQQGFQSKTLFKSHVLLHIEEKQYTCTDCDNKYCHKKDPVAQKNDAHDMSEFRCKVASLDMRPH